MKKVHADHLGMRILLADRSKGKVVKVSKKGYSVKRLIGESVIIPLSDIRWSEGKQKLYQIKGERDFTGLICQLVNCGPKIDGVIVKVVAKYKEGYRFLFSNGFGGDTYPRCLIPITKETVFLDNSWDILIVDNKTILCDCCKQPFKHSELELYSVPLKEWHKQGVICKNCLSMVSPLLKLVKQRPEDAQLQRVGARELKTFEPQELVELNGIVSSTVSELATRHGLLVEESRKQLRPTAMEYVIHFKLPQDSDDRRSKPDVDTSKVVKTIKKMKNFSKKPNLQDVVKSKTKRGSK